MCSRNISIYDYYNGFEYLLKHFNEMLTISHNPYLKGKDLILPNYGLQGSKSRGDLIIIFQVDMDFCSLDIMDRTNTLKELFDTLIPIDTYQ